MIDADAARKLLRDAALRVTPARVSVLRAVHAASSPVSHAEVAEAIGAGMDRVTVYRNLMTLSDAGLVVRADLGDRMWRFSAPIHAVQEPVHPHLVCSVCGRVQCLEPSGADLREALGIPATVLTSELEIQVRAVCAECGDR